MTRPDNPPWTELPDRERGSRSPFRLLRPLLNSLYQNSPGLISMTLGFSVLLFIPSSLKGQLLDTDLGVIQAIGGGVLIAAARGL